VKNIIAFIFFSFYISTNTVADEKSLDVGCKILLDLKEDNSHIENSLGYFQDRLNKNDKNVAIFLIHTFADLQTLKNLNDCFYNANRIYGTNNELALKILLKYFPIIDQYEFRNIYLKYYQYQNKNKNIINKIKSETSLFYPKFLDELIEYLYSQKLSNYQDSLKISDKCYFENEILKKIEYCKKSAEKNDLYASVFLVENFFFGIEDPNKKGFFLKESKNFELTDIYISKSQKIILNLNEDIFSHSWIKNFDTYKPYIIYKKAISGDKEAQYKMGYLTLDYVDNNVDKNHMAYLEKYYGSLILEKKDYYDGKYIPNCIQALSWFEKSANQNFGPAQFMLSEFYLSGRFGGIFTSSDNLNINKNPIGQICKKEIDEKKTQKGYELLLKAVKNNEYRAQCKLGLLYSFRGNKKDRNLELGLDLIRLSQKERSQNLWRDGYTIPYYKLYKKGFDIKQEEKCGKNDYSYLFPENHYYDQDIKFDDFNDFTDLVSGKMINKNYSRYEKLIIEKKILKYSD